MEVGKDEDTKVNHGDDYGGGCLKRWRYSLADALQKLQSIVALIHQFVDVIRTKRLSLDAQVPLTPRRILWHAEASWRHIGQR
jgi:hypothetical protein